MTGKLANSLVTMKKSKDTEFEGSKGSTSKLNNPKGGEMPAKPIKLGSKV